MFQFKRRTLWIIIYITIPLIIILNRLGLEDPAPVETPQVKQVVWSLDEVQNQCDSGHCWLPLAGAQSVYLTAILDVIPIAAVTVPNDVQFSTQALGGKWLAHWQFESNPAAIARVEQMIQAWLPANAQPTWVLSSASKTPLEQVLKINAAATAAGLPFSLPAADAPNTATEFSVPSVADADQLAYLMWFEVLKRRLGNSKGSIQWDHRREQSRVLVSAELSEKLFTEVAQAELSDIVEIYQAAANQRERDQATLHRYAVNASVYQLSLHYFVQQPERLRQLTRKDVNRVREQTLGQIQKN